MPAATDAGLLVNCSKCKRVCWAPGPKCPTCLAREEFVTLYPAATPKPRTDRSEKPKK